MLKIQNKSTKRIRIVLIIFFLIQIFLTTQPFVWDESSFRFGSSGEGETAGFGDTIVLNVRGKVDGKTFAKFDDWTTMLGKDSYLPGFDEKIVGHEKNEKFTFEFKLPENYNDEEYAGKTATYKVKIVNLSRKYVYTALDFVSLIGSTDYRTGELVGSLNTIGMFYLSFLIIPLIALGFQIFDFYYNLKNVVGFICSVLGVLAIIYFVTPSYICIGSVLTLLIYLFTGFMCVMGMLARYLKREESVVKKKEHNPDDIV